MKAKKIIILLMVFVIIGSGAVTAKWFYDREKQRQWEESHRDTDMDGIYDVDDDNPEEWDVCDRDLAIFSRLCYRSGSRYVGSMLPSDTAFDAEGIPGYNLGETDPGIFARWTIADYTEKNVSGAGFSATTYVNGNNVVIAYRGTDDIGDLTWDIVGVGVLDYHVEEGCAKEYALKIARQYPNAKLYITGHSLGGYLAQIGATALLEENYDNLESIVYFNGIGLEYASNEVFSKQEITGMLTEFSKKKRLISYEINGDVVSSIGEHVGEIISFDACQAMLDNYAKFQDSSSYETIGGMFALASLQKLLGNSFIKYYVQYQTGSVVGYLNVTHRMENFLGILERQNTTN